MEETMVDPRVASIKYKVIGSFKNYISAVTSFDDVYREDALKEVSLVTFPDFAAASSYLDALTLCQGPNITRCFFIIDNKKQVLIDRINGDIESWIEQNFTDFTNQQLETQKWWIYLEPKFKKLFSDVVLGFNHLVRLDAHSGELRNSISVDLAKNSARFSKVIRSPPNDDSGIMGNMYQLKSLIEDCLLRPYKGVPSVGLPEDMVEHYMNQQGIPEDLKLLLWILQDAKTLRKFDIKWVLDPPFFWSNPKKFSFVRKVHCQAYRLHDIDYTLDLDMDLFSVFRLGFHQGWKILLPTDGPVRKIFEHNLEDQKNSLRKRGGVGRIPFDSFFLGITIMFKNIVGHYSTHAGGAVPDEISIGIADRVFKCSCAYLQYVMGRYFFEHTISLQQQGLQQQGKPWNFYLSEEKY